MAARSSRALALLAAGYCQGHGENWFGVAQQGAASPSACHEQVAFEAMQLRLAQYSSWDVVCVKASATRVQPFRNLPGLARRPPRQCQVIGQPRCTPVPARPRDPGASGRCPPGPWCCAARAIPGGWCPRRGSRQIPARSRAAARKLGHAGRRGAPRGKAGEHGRIILCNHLAKRVPTVLGEGLLAHREGWSGYPRCHRTWENQERPNTPRSIPNRVIVA